MLVSFIVFENHELQHFSGELLAKHFFEEFTKVVLQHKTIALSLHLGTEDFMGCKRVSDVLLFFS